MDRKECPVSTVTAPFGFEGAAIVVKAKVNGKVAEFLIDNVAGVAFTAMDFQRLGLSPENEGRVKVDIDFGGTVVKGVEGVVDLSVSGYSRLGIDFFTARAEELTISFADDELSFTVADEKKPAAKAAPARKAA